ncbi:hypothetical protein [Deinococcus cellulosilyticus]|uniref:Uncharacterized protein n=1 Tax=Deinococcus cellulosilyticus (strain DSM 18568 / NBRC 106333 / KACC 11606 / 5516J-15) TaxID=1223518 RepID=A0A511N5R9_DEIC1|nr:hypothetical protein [Deinococcus cellulosilyticus]GEM47807.1 hypothetical protein DC3_34420 [Deinococcus cellulosilyticus NBRC 106333 = KACC 11606]
MKSLNGYALFTGLFFLLAFGIHVFMGGQEVLQFQPSSPAGHQNWLMKVGAFHLVTVDLLVLAAGLIFASLRFPKATVLYQVVSGLCLLYAVSWLLQLALWHQSTQDFLMLGQWVLFLIAAGGAWLASRKPRQHV